MTYLVLLRCQYGKKQCRREGGDERRETKIVPQTTVGLPNARPSLVHGQLLDLCLSYVVLRVSGLENAGDFLVVVREWFLKVRHGAEILSQSTFGKGCS